MGFTDIFKGKQYKSELETLQQKYEDLQSLLTPEMQNAFALQNKIRDLDSIIQQRNQTISDCDNTIISKNAQLEDIERHISDRKTELVSVDEEILVQEFGLYKPHYDFANALEYKEKLSEIRAKQKAMIKNKTAVSGFTSWQVNGSASKGKKMVSDTQKLLLRAFNNECDEVVGKVKYTNFDASLNRINKSAETISKLGTIMGISINRPYLNLKIEQTHYQTAYEKLLKQLESSPDDADLIQKKSELETQLQDIDKAMKDIDYREANQRAGYVYIISNIGAFGENVYKIGMTRRLDPQDRVDELGDASVPFNFDVHAMIFSDDAPALEAALHKAFEDRKLNMVNTRREFFNVTLDEIKEVVKKNFDKTVEFIDVADAEQYRISQKMKHQSK